LLKPGRGDSGKEPKTSSRTERKHGENPGSVRTTVLLWPMNEHSIIKIKAEKKG